MTLYSGLLLLHVFAIVAWVGGMTFALFCLRPAALAVLSPPQRLQLMHAALGRFFQLVGMAIAVLLVSGTGMIVSAGVKQLSITWLWMIGLGVVMMMIFVQIRVVPFARLGKCLAVQDWPAAAGHIQQIRVMVILNLAIGLTIIAIMKIGSR